MISYQNFCIFTSKVEVTSNSSEVPGVVQLALKVDGHHAHVSFSLSLQQATDIVEALSMAVECAAPAQDVTSVRDCESVEF